MAVANAAWGGWYLDLPATPISLRFGAIKPAGPFPPFIDDALVAGTLSGALAFASEAQDVQVRRGVLVAFVVAALPGYAFLRAALPPLPDTASRTTSDSVSTTSPSSST